ncbi:prepilin-type N-terminal cleavage/methylation domain-containing protein [Coraliomargarita akajimensis]|nr:prepilin-type N-terminal cleavage/methylation domain-containing protein [Coraliomargarita akajimensis]
MKSRQRGFTLIELLVVITIIVVAASIIMVAGRGGEGTALRASQRILSGIANGARGQALLKNAETRLIIYGANPGGSNFDYDKYRRFFGIVYRDPSDSTKWIAATQGTYLPEGIYFDPTESAAETGFKINYPRATPQTEGVGDEYYYYTFNSNGTIGSDFQNGPLIIRAMSLRPASSGNLELVVDAAQEKIISGMIFRRAGTTTIVSDPEDALDLKKPI